MNALLGELVERAARLLGVDSAAFFTRDDDRWTVERVSGVLLGHPGAYRVYPDGMVELATKRRAPILLSALEPARQLSTVFVECGIRDALAVPLLEGELVTGVLALHSCTANYFTPLHLAQATALADSMSAVLRRRDHTELAELERQSVVEKNELRFRAFMTAIPASAWVKDEDGRYLFANQRVQAQLRDRPVEGATDDDLFPPETARAVRAEDRRVLQTFETSSTEETMPGPTGPRTWLTTRFPIVEPSGAVTVGGMALDVTDRVAAQQALIDATAEFERMFDLLSDGVTITTNASILWANRAVHELLGVAQGSLLGRNLREFVPDDERDNFEHTRTEIPTENSHSWERRLRRADGQLLYFETTGRRVRFRGQPAVVAILRDVTLRRAQQQRLQLTERLASVGTLAAGVAHEINNPLSYVLTNLGLIADRVGPTAPDELYELATEAREGAERIRRIVEGMRTMARPADPSRRVPVSLAHVVQQALDLTRTEVSLRARVELELGPLSMVLGDEPALVQVLVNLLSNAAQAIPPDGKAHLVRVTGLTLKDGRVRLSVIDDGAGIEPEVLPRIFDPFFTTKPVNLGTGLGLSVSHGIAVSHGGELTVESTPGQGATFHLTLPPAPLEVRPPAAPPRRASVLVIDDDVLVARSLARALAPHAVTVVHKADEALALLNSSVFDLVLCDVMMPGLDGPAIVSRVPATVAERFAFITGGAFTSAGQRFVDETSHPVLTKPIDRGRLMQLAEASLTRRAP